MSRNKEPSNSELKKIEHEQENLNDLDDLFSVRCKRCRKKINLKTCSFDEYENPICRGGC